ncbi:MAG: 5'/3'-nucleotidase SurE [Anaerovoracaceae bacterium]
MNILVANDDGIKATGLSRLVESLSEVAEVYVCAPHTQRSATGHGITIGKPIGIKEVKFPKAKLAFEITGLPADCVKVGLKVLEDRKVKIDMVFSGINHGGNLGTDTLYSGTVSAALEGSICGLPSVAVSVNDHNATHFDTACRLAVEVCQNGSSFLSPDVVLNINTPDLPEEEIRGLKITRLGRREYKDFFKPKVNQAGEREYWYQGEPVVYEGLPHDIDVISMQDGYASITPLHHNMTANEELDKLEEWRVNK